MKNHLTFVIVLVGVLVVGSCVIYKASHASMTHDESSTYLNLVALRTLDLGSCYHNPECWTTANNHLLNTLLMRWSDDIFGSGELSLRLGNLLLCLVYLWCVLVILRKSARTPAEALLGLALLTCNPFVLDFFALARGYGMGLGFTMLSIFGMWQYVHQSKAGYAVLAFASALAAVFANLIYVAYVAAMVITVFLFIVVPLLRRSWRGVFTAVPVSMAGCTVLLFAYFYRPVQILKDLGEFKYGAETFRESWMRFASDSLYGVSWIGNATPQVVAQGSAILIALCIMAAFRPLRQSQKTAERKFEQLVATLCIAMVLFFMCNHMLTGASYPSGRKTIIVFVPLSLLVYSVIRRMLSGMIRWGQVSMALIGIILILHFVRAYQPGYFREWWYDANTKEMTYYVADKTGQGDTVTLGVEWIFHPSTQFYVQTRNLPILLSPYSKDILKHDPVQFYYVSPEFVSNLEPNFGEERNFGGRLLLKRK